MNEPVISSKKTFKEILQAMPKIDLHRHLEGSLRLFTLADIATKHGVDMQALDIEELRPLVQVVDDDEPNFQNFLAKFEILRKFYNTREAVLRIAYEVVVDAAKDNVKYLELQFNPVAQAYHQGFSLEEVVDWVIEAVKRAEQAYDIQVKLIMSLNRGDAPEFASHLVELAVARQADGMVGLDLAGNEEHISAKPFRDLLLWAKSEGMHLTVHAGECQNCSASNIYDAVEYLKAERIGHGVRAINDPKIIRLLSRQQVTLEMCPTSNFQTASIDTLACHPLRAFYRAGIPVTINTDDPSVSNITLSDEYAVALRVIGITFDMLKDMILNAARAAFLPEAERAQLVKEFEQALQGFELP